MNEILQPFYKRAKECYELKELEKLGLTPDMDQRSMILDYLSLIFKWNSEADLISQKDEEKLFLYHFCDSIQPLLLFGFKKNGYILDIGAGGGFPTIPISIFRSDLSFIVYEINKIKLDFLKEVKKILKLKNIKIFCDQIENIPTPENKFDYVISRGMGSLTEIAQIGKPFVSKEGRIYTFKKQQFEKELSEITMNKDKNGVGISEIAEYDLGNQIFGLNLVSLALV
jgi:16S rRNA (guanine527-N7)-methyltransferase